MEQDEEGERRPKRAKYENSMESKAFLLLLFLTSVKENITLSDLLKDGALQIGQELYVTWKSEKKTGFINEKGQIVADSNAFDTPSAWVCYLNGTWTSRSGWQVVRVKENGRPLKEFKDEYLSKRKLLSPPSSSSSPAASQEQTNSILEQLLKGITTGTASQRFQFIMENIPSLLEEDESRA
jgi:hypothetical protein